MCQGHIFWGDRLYSITAFQHKNRKGQLARATGGKNKRKGNIYIRKT